MIEYGKEDCKMSDTIALLSDIEKIRESPGMYIGDDDRLGMDTIVREIIDNAKDEYPNFADKDKPIIVVIKPGNIVSVRDYGRGISPYPSIKIKGWLEERIAYTHVGAGGKFRDNREKNGNQFAGGLHGTGACGTNAMSEWFEVEIWKDGRHYKDRYEEGIPVTELVDGLLPSEPIDTNETGTMVTFKASSKFLRTTKVDVQYVKSIMQDAAYLNPGLRLILRNERDNEEEQVFYSSDGLLGYMKELLKDENGMPVSCLMKPFVIHGKSETEPAADGRVIHMEANIAVTFARGENSASKAYTNGIENKAGGTHLKGFYQGLIDLLKYYYEEFQSEFTTSMKTQLELIKNVKKLNAVSDVFNLIKPRSIARKTFVIIDFKHEAPKLRPQTKEELWSPEAKDAVADIFFRKARLYFDQHITAVQDLITFLIRDLYETAKNENTTIELSKTEAKLLLSTKLAAAKSKNPKECEIFIVEGDSAGGGCKEMRRSMYQAVLPLRGKILNARKTTLARMLSNPEISTMVLAFACGLGSNYDESKLRYHKIIITVDADIDGTHIAILLITFFWTYMPDLIRNGHVYILNSPLYVNVLKGNKGTHYTYTEDEQAEWINKNRRSVADVQRNKGLGELEKEQVVETILRPETRRLSRLVVNDEEQFEMLMDQLMGRDTATRKQIFMPNVK